MPTINSLGSVRPCCDSSMGLMNQILSDSCDYCSDSERTSQQTLMELPVNKGNTTGVPYCDPNASLIDNLLSNSCIDSVPQAISQTLGLPSNTPAWVYWSTIGGISFLVLKGVFK